MAMPGSLTVSSCVQFWFVQTTIYFQDSALKARGCKSSSKVWTEPEDKMLQQKKLANKWESLSLFKRSYSPTTCHMDFEYVWHMNDKRITWTLNMYDSIFILQNTSELYVMEKGKNPNWFKQTGVSSKVTKKRKKYYPLFPTSST